MNHVETRDEQVEAQQDESKTPGSEALGWIRVPEDAVLARSSSEVAEEIESQEEEASGRLKVRSPPPIIRD